MKSRIILGHGLSLLCILIWGSTFVVTRLLLDAGMSPTEIMIYRFVIAYIVLWIIHPRFMRPTSVWREILYFLAGACGVTLYFWTENQGLAYTTVSNTSLLVASSPLFTGLLAALLWRQKLNFVFFAGFVVAMTGIALIFFQGGRLELHPKGDILALTSAFFWAVYSLSLKQAEGKNDNVLAVTRRVFFYGILLFIPLALIFKVEFHLALFKESRHVLEILFLSVIASALCYIAWNQAMRWLGPVKTSLYIYLIPVTALLTARLLFDETLPPLGWIGAALVITGLLISNAQVPASKR